MQFPTYEELVKHSRKQQRHRKWQKLLHSLGIHTWRTYWQGRCKVWCAGLFLGPVKTEGMARLQTCLFCTKERGLIDNGMACQEFDADFIKAQAGI
jgi:hypothetical protein